MVRIVLLLLFGVSLSVAYAEPVATLDRTLWPESLASHPGFNAASRLEIRNFAGELMASELVPPDEWPQRLGLPRVDMLAIDHYRAQSWLRLLAAFQAASRECRNCPQVRNVEEFRQLVMRPPTLPARLQAWQAESRQFHARYLQEQLTQAAQLPLFSSEMNTLTSNELTGFELMDGEFLLSFEGGPTLARGTTWRTARALANAGQNGVFFLSGEPLAQRLQSSPEALAEEYGENCVASNGMPSTSPSDLENWRDGVRQSRRLLNAIPVVTQLPWFRPPSGQSASEMDGQIFERIVLWNIDSQDMEADLSARQVADRVTTLMLLWRKGIIRWHDSGPKAAVVLPGLFQALQTSPVRWVDCRTFADH
jgi:peptidoglycan-N-acetylglucosamine deacetylase